MIVKDAILSLDGEWKLILQPEKGGTEACGTICLPSTVTEQGYGDINENRELLFLSEKRKFVGTAIFEKVFNLPEYGCSRVVFCMERTRLTKVVVNGVYAGTRDALTTEQKYDITSFVHPGQNSITVFVDNTYKEAPRDAILGSHMATEHTQTNWNGILGRIEIQIRPYFAPSKIRVLPNAKNKTAVVKMDFLPMPETCGTDEIPIHLRITQPDFPSEKSHVISCNLKRQSLNGSKKDEEEIVTTTIALDPATPFWSEFSPKMTRIQVETECGTDTAVSEVSFGLRDFRVDPDHHHFNINGFRTFLRSEANCCVFPLTGYAPMDDKSWETLFLTYKLYGVNYVRFHSWCPPEAAFRSADRLGIYMQPELCEWSFHTFENDFEYDYYTREAENIVSTYANHPSFVAMTWGNELRSDNRERMGELCRKMREYDSTRLYAEGSNTWYGAKGINPAADFVMAQQNYGNLWRGAFAGNHGFINDEMPGEDHTYSKELKNVSVPAVSFEVGQFQSYPDYSEIEAYKGVLEARNLCSYRETLAKNGLEGCDRNFHFSSGKLAERCYREEIEAAMRTPELAGISLLGLQDFPGQGTALVGMMDSFGKPKSFSDPGTFHCFFAEVVPLLSFHKYVYQEGETARFTAIIHNYGPSNITDPVFVHFNNESGRTIFEGEWKNLVIPQGTVTEVGKFSFTFPVSEDHVPKTVLACIQIGSHTLNYTLYVFPVPKEIPTDSIVRKINEESISRLSRGEKLLFLPNKAPDSIPESFPVSYISDFWCWIMFSKWDASGTMGICPDMDSTLWENFPTAQGTDPRWWNLLHGARAVRVTGSGVEVLLSAIDNIQRNEQLSLVMQAKVGNGALLISTCNTDDLHNPVVNAFLYALLRYLHSDCFKPSVVLTTEELLNLFQGEGRELVECRAVRNIIAGVNTKEAVSVLTDEEGSWSTRGSTSDKENYIEINFDTERYINTVRIDFLSDTAYASRSERLILPDSYEILYCENETWRKTDVIFQSSVSDSNENICYFRAIFSKRIRIQFLLHAGSGVNVMQDKVKIRESIAVRRVRIYEAASIASVVGEKQAEI